MDFKLSAPIEVRLEVTRECNLRCIHCYNNSYYKSPSELEYLEVVNIIDQLEEMRVFDIVIEGGEPLLRKDIFDILQYMKGKFKVGIITNGTLINEKRAQRLSELIDYIQISLDGATASTNNSIRGEGVFYSTIKGIKAIVEANTPVVISMVMMKQNIHEIERFVELGEELGVTACNFARLQPTGRAQKNFNKISLSSQEVKNAINTILKIKKSKKRIKILIPLYCFPFLLSHELLPYYEETDRSNIECSEGLGILANGDVVPCPVFLNLVAGNIRKNKLEEIWNTSSVLQSLRKVRIKGKCENCFYFPFCRGGCRGLAYLETEDIEAPDPMCWAFEDKK